MLNFVLKCQNVFGICCLLQENCARSVWTLVSPSLVPLGQRVMLFHRETSSACVHLVDRGNFAKTVSEFCSNSVPQTLLPNIFSFS
jgi:hypothetical protein